LVQQAKELVQSEVGEIVKETKKANDKVQQEDNYV
jgi:hypothetical protein